MWRNVKIGLTLVALTGCKEPVSTAFTDGTPVVVTTDGMLTTTTWHTRTDLDGLVEIPVQVEPDTTAFLVSASTGAERPMLQAVIDPEGVVVLDAVDWLGHDEDLTGAFSVARHTNTLNWPVRPSDGPLIEGEWLTVWASVHLEDLSTQPDDSVDVAVITKADPDPDQGVVTVHMVWADGVESGTGHTTAVENAVARWTSDWAAYGLDVQTQFHTSTLDPGLSLIDYGSLDLFYLSEQIADPGDLLVVLGDTMVSRPNTFGHAAGTPGSPLATRYHYVAIALDMFVSPIGAPVTDVPLSAAVAHEVSHFMGLPHVVEKDWVHWDALADTPRCTNESQCELQLGDNVLFPYSYCDPGCGPYSLTPDQQAVLHGYVGVR